MNKCQCGREFTTPQGLGKHKTKCGKLGVDNGYLYRIDNNGVTQYIHREVAEQKIGRKLFKDEIVHHMDRDKQNNNPDNIEVTTRPIHMSIHKEDIEVHKIYNYGEKIGNSKLTEVDVKEIKQIFGQYNNCEIARMYKIDESTVRSIKKGNSWKHISV